MIAAEIEFCKMPFQMPLADMVINTIYATLEDREVSLDGISVNIASHIFAGTMVYHAVLLKTAPQAHRRSAFSHNGRSLMHLSFQDRAQHRGGYCWNMMRLNLTAALDKREDGFLASAPGPDMLALAAVLVLLQSADKGLVDLNRFCLRRQVVPFSERA